MNAASKQATTGANARDLREALDWFRSKGYLIETDKEVNPDLEITGLQKIFDGSLPMLFNNVKGKPHARAITNLFGDIRVVEELFGWRDSLDRVKKVAYALDHPLKPVIIPQEDAPVQQEVLTDDLDTPAPLDSTVTDVGGVELSGITYTLTFETTIITFDSTITFMETCLESLGWYPAWNFGVTHDTLKFWLLGGGNSTTCCGCLPFCWSATCRLSANRPRQRLPKPGLC